MGRRVAVISSAQPDYSGVIVDAFAAHVGTFTTESNALAGLLHLCGEKCLWVGNQYEAEKLRENNNRATILHSQGVRGRVAYGFKSTKRASAIIKAFEEQKARIDANMEVVVNIDDWTLATIAASYIHTLNVLVRGWKENPSTVFDRVGDKAFKIVSTNASSETLRKIGA